MSPRMVMVRPAQAPPKASQHPELGGMPIYPELRNCLSPSAPHILRLFSSVQRHYFVSGKAVVLVFEAHFTGL